MPHRETETHFTAGMSSQRNHSDSFRFKCAAFYQSLKRKVGLAGAKATVLRINLNVEVCVIVAAPVHTPSRDPLLLPLLLSHNLSPPRSLVRDGQPSPHRPWLVVSRSTCPPLSPSPHANSFIKGTAVINTHGGHTGAIFASTFAHLADIASGPSGCPRNRENDDVLFIGTRFSNLYTSVDTPAQAALGHCTMLN
jgi:hypothetical protein